MSLHRERIAILRFALAAREKGLPLKKKGFALLNIPDLIGNNDINERRLIEDLQRMLFMEERDLRLLAWEALEVVAQNSQ
jgi:hypothetical protein